MELNTHFSKIVEEITADITSNVVMKVDGAINNAINHRLSVYDFSSYIQEATQKTVEKKIAEYTIDSKKLENRTVDKIRETLNNAQSQTHNLVETYVKEKLSNLDLNKIIIDAVGVLLHDKLTDFTFPKNSIDPTAIKISNLEISGDNVKGGTIENFSSTGIDDRTTQIALTLLDESTVIENNLLTKHLTVQGSVTIDGDLTLNGTVTEDTDFYRKLVSGTTKNTLDSLNENLFSRYSTNIFDKIRNDGLDLNKITLNGEELITKDSLGKGLTKSNLQNLGELNELQVKGESFFAQTLYVTQKRIGINTIEPSAALTIWDEEIEIISKKKAKDIGIMGTSRHQKLVLSSNNKENIILNEDGSTQIENLRVGAMRFTTSNTPPNFVSERCHVVWNTNPNPGGPLGWICLGGANWANFGIID